MSSSSEAIRFSSAFRRMIKVTGGSPDHLQSNYHLDKSLQELAREVAIAAMPFEMDMLLQPDLVVSPVDKGFTTLWRQYQDGYSQLLIGLPFDLFGKRGEILQRSRKVAPEEIWRLSDQNALDEMGCIDRVFQLAKEEYELRGELSEEGLNAQFEWEFDTGLRLWDDILPAIGIDIKSTLRRYSLLTQVWLPQHVPARTVGHKVAPAHYLKSALHAFVMNCDIAAFVLMRTTLETTLREHYLAEFCKIPNNCRSLEEMIDKAKHDLPRGVTTTALTRIRQRTNDLVHEGKQRETRKIIGDVRKFEIFMVNSLNQLRILIENAPGT